MKKKTSRMVVSLVSSAAMMLSCLSAVPSFAFADTAEEVFCDLSDCFTAPTDEIIMSRSFVSPEEHTFGTSYYDQLDDESKDIYNKLYEIYKDGPNTENIEIAVKLFPDCVIVKDSSGVSFSSETSTRFSNYIYSTFYDALGCLAMDHPELYWISSNKVTTSSSTSVIGGGFYDTGDNYRDVQLTIRNKFEYNSCDENADSGKEYIDNAIAAAKDTIGDVDGPYTALYGIHKYLCHVLEYNYDELYGKYSSNEARMYQTAYSAFYACNGDAAPKTVCKGYTSGFKVLCDAYDIPCVIVSGVTDTGGNHAWNYVKIGEEWYGVDCTWDDQGSRTYEDYFLCGADTVPTHFNNPSFAECHFADTTVYSRQTYPMEPPEISKTAFDTSKKTVSLISTTEDGSVQSIVPLKVLGKSNSFYEGDTVTVSAEEMTGYKFLGWYNADDESGYSGEKVCADTEYSFVMGKTSPKLAAVYRHVEQAAVSFNSDSGSILVSADGNAPETILNDTVFSYNVGTKLTVTAEDDDFAYWANESGNIVSKSSSYTFTVSNSCTIRAVYNNCGEENAIVNFVSAYDQVLSRIVCTDSDIIPIPNTPTKLNGVFEGWSVNGKTYSDPEELVYALKEAAAKAIASYDTADNMITVKAVYSDAEGTAHITVSGGTGAGTYALNSVVTVTADDPTEGQKFSHWINEYGTTLSYNSTYSFYAVKDVLLEAVYCSEAADLAPVGTAKLDFIKADNEARQISVVGVFTVPEGCTMETAGILATGRYLSDDDFNEKNASLASQAPGNVKSYRFDRIVNVSEANVGKPFLFRAYLVYTDADGNVHKVYSEIDSSKISE